MKKSETAEKAWAARRAKILEIERFSLQARVSSGGLFGVKGNLTWTQGKDDFDMRVAGPFGVGATTISGRGKQVEIKSGKGVFTTQDPEADLHTRLGWSFPVSHLRYWVLGSPAPGSRAEYVLDDKGRLGNLGQDGWELTYDEYQRAGGVDLPKKFTITNTEVKIKVFVDTWTVE